LEKSPPAAGLGRSASTTSARNGSITGQRDPAYSPAAENQSTRAVAGSTAVLDDVSPVGDRTSYALQEGGRNGDITPRNSSFVGTPTWRENPAAPNPLGIDTTDVPEWGITTVRQKIQTAVEAEIVADRAIEAARKAVTEARSVVVALEQQAHAEFERAHAKRTEAAGIVQDVGKLGRHGD